MIKARSGKRQNQGFSMAEVLMTIAILVIVMLLAVPALFSLQKNLRQKELDDKAQIIYASVQNKLSKMKAGGDTQTYQFNEGSNLVAKVSSGSEPARTAEESKLCYITSEELGTADAAAFAIMSDGTLDDGLLHNEWVIEYNPTNASVYGVFYSESIDCVKEYKEDTTYRTKMCQKSKRLEAGAKVGYYGVGIDGGGAAGSGSAVTMLVPSLSITNAEKLEAEIYCTLATGDLPVFKLEISDTNGHTYTRYYAHSTANKTNVQNVAGTQDIDYTSMKKDTSLFTVKVVLDDLSASATRFVKTYGKQSSHSVKLDAGTGLTLKVTAMCPDNYKVTQNRSVTRRTNSLFADESTSEKALVFYGRHLQNLDSSSGVIDGIKSAEQGRTLTFTDSAAQEGIYDWQETYEERFFNKYTEVGGKKRPNFKPISNLYLTSYDGGSAYRIVNLHVNEKQKAAGLFETLAKDQTVKNVKMTGSSIQSSQKAAGALVGEITHKAAIENCQVFLTRTDLAGKTNHDVWVQGATAAGGLIGSIMDGTITVKSCSASTVVGGHTFDKAQSKVNEWHTQNAGGLIGSVRNGHINIQQSYADCYLFGTKTGGVVGSTNVLVNLQYCYAAGFVTFPKQNGEIEGEGAGLVCGRATINHSYTVVDKNDTDAAAIYHTTAKNGAGTSVASDVYYAAEATEAGEKFGTSIAGKTIEELTQALDSGKFRSDTTTTQAYGLMGQALSGYTFPQLQGLIHYGDWKAYFQSGALVYYEVYKNKNTLNPNEKSYGFFGANIDSTLKDDPNLTVVGDGYGVVYLDNTSDHPSNVSVKIDNKESILQLSDNSATFHSVEAGTGAEQKTYRIYPLETAAVNAERKVTPTPYYSKVTITQNEKAEYYYFNPHFAKTVVHSMNEAAAAPTLNSDSKIAVRTGRHLYLMSLYYETYAKETANCTFQQERNIDYASYDWKDYSTRTEENPRSQSPIAGNTEAFRAVYDGQCNWIRNVSFVGTGDYVGMIGHNSGIVENVVLRASYEEGSNDNHYVSCGGGSISNKEVSIGILVGKNESEGRIRNCAADGYYISGSNGTIHASENSHLNAGGLVGCNEGTIMSSTANTPIVRLSSSFATVCIGGFVGDNRGSVGNSYAIGHIEVAYVRGGSVSIAGFAGKNSSRIQSSYCATALTSGGETTTAYGFAPSGGMVFSCQYLNGGTYTYLGHIYPFNFDEGVGEATTFQDLSSLKDTQKADESYDFSSIAPVQNRKYPFRAVVSNAAGKLVHYGNWMEDENMGQFGIFYWEHETGGQNNGYHLTYLGRNEDGTYTGGTSLCNAHDDGGIISEYGYGYFELNKGSVTELKMTDVEIRNPVATKTEQKGETKKRTVTFQSNADNASYNKTASEELQKQMSLTLEGENKDRVPYHFYAFTTRREQESNGGDYLCMAKRSEGNKDSHKWNYVDNSTWTLTINGGNTYSYNVCPFFANAMSVQDLNVSLNVVSMDGKNTNYAQIPGEKNVQNPYEIRSIEQLQFINWSTQKAHYDDVESNHNSYDKSGVDGRWFPYECVPKSYDQTHDIRNSEKAGIPTNFYPLGRSSRNFRGEYDGNSYQIKNININVEGNCYVGLFGELGPNSSLQNVIMTAEEGKGKVISRYNNNKDAREVTVGALVGMIWTNNNKDKPITIRNCSSSGYLVQYAGTLTKECRYISVGGLAGSLFSATMENCSAVNTVEVKLSKELEQRQQLGGLVGTSANTGGGDAVIKNCYSGGEVIPDTSHIKETYENTGSGIGYLCGGLVGNAMGHSTSNSIYGTDDTWIEDCYTYCDVPESSCKWRFSGDQNLSGCWYVATNVRNAGRIKNTYYLEYPNRKSISCTDKKLVQNIGISCTYGEMLNENLLKKFVGEDNTSDINDTGSVDANYNGFHRVTTTEGQHGGTVDGKYSHPIAKKLEGKNYPFPAIIRQKDLTFSTQENPVYVYVHYGDWPTPGPYWEDGRDKMDIFTDMKEKGSDGKKYAEKTFRLYLNGRTLEELGFSDSLQAGNFKSSKEDVAKVVNVGTVENGSCLITVRALKIGSSQISLQLPEKTLKEFEDLGIPPAVFTLEVTAQIHLEAEPLPMKLKKDQTSQLTLKASSEDKKKSYETDDNTSWKVVPSEERLLTIEQPDKITKKNIWNITRNDLGKVTLAATFTYKYHEEVISAVTYVDVRQFDMIGLSDVDGTVYNAAYLGETNKVGTNISYGEGKAPKIDNCDFFLYLEPPERKFDEFEIVSVSVNGTQLQKSSTDGSYTGNSVDGCQVSLSAQSTRDANYQYLRGTISPKEKKAGATLEIKIREKSTPPTGKEAAVQEVVVGAQDSYTLTITFPKKVELLDGKNVVYQELLTQEKEALGQDINKLVERDRCELDGWYTDRTGNGQKVLDASGRAVAEVAGFSKKIAENQFVLAPDSDKKLYARWKKTLYAFTERMEAGNSYLIANGNQAGEGVVFGDYESEGQVHAYVTIHPADNLLSTAVYIEHESISAEHMLFTCIDLAEQTTGTASVVEAKLALAKANSEPRKYLQFGMSEEIQKNGGYAFTEDANAAAVWTYNSAGLSGQNGNNTGTTQGVFYDGDMFIFQSDNVSTSPSPSAAPSTLSPVRLYEQKVVYLFFNEQETQVVVPDAAAPAVQEITESVDSSEVKVEKTDGILQEEVGEEELEEEWIDGSEEEPEEVPAQVSEEELEEERIDGSEEELH